MADSIFHRQNDPFLLQCQIAQRSEYSCAKRIFMWKTGFVLAFTIVSIAATILDVDWLTATSSLLAIALVLYNKYSEEQALIHKRQASAIQQYIDVSLFAPAIGSNEAEWGSIPSASDLACAVGKYKNCDLTPMKNWYSDYSLLPGERQIFYCQKENIRWDHDLHKKFKKLLIKFLSIVIVVLATIFLIVNPSLVKFICVLSWFAPIAEFTYSIYIEVQKSIVQLQDIDQYSAEIEKKFETIGSRTFKQMLIKLQYKILEKRGAGFMIPDWFYEWHKKRHQNNEDSVAKTIQQLNAKRGI